jgi:hypothetical protein
VNSPLRPIPGTRDGDFFRCGRCEHDFSIPL